MFPYSSVRDAELEEARYRNDMVLKSRFRAIFQKYSHDFSGIGDEIDVTTGRIVVDNGHLQTMEHEKDIGPVMPQVQERSSKSANINGQSLVRAMTPAPDRYTIPRTNIREDNVIESIETMAEHASMLFRDPLGSDTEDELLGCGSRKHSEDSKSEDSLLGIGRDNSLRRSSTRDSLFEGQETLANVQSLQASKSQSNSTKASASCHSSARALCDEGTLDKFGARIGHEVLEVIHQRHAANESYVEPVWRIPDIADPIRELRMVAISEEAFTEAQNPVATRGCIRGRDATSSTIINNITIHRSTSTESLDPLQQQSVDEKHMECEEGKNIDIDDVENEEPVPEACDIDRKCSFCHKQLSDINGLHQHWKNVLKRPQSHGVHDIDYIAHELNLARRQLESEALTQEPSLSKQMLNIYAYSNATFETAGTVGNQLDATYNNPCSIRHDWNNCGVSTYIEASLQKYTRSTPNNDTLRKRSSEADVEIKMEESDDDIFATNEV